MSFLNQLSSRLEPRYVQIGRAVWRVERVNSDEIRRQGFATLEGGAAAQEALKRVQADLERRHDEASGLAPEVIDQRQEHDRAADRRRGLEVYAAMTRDPAGQLAHLQRCDAYCMAAVSGVAPALEHVHGEADGRLGEVQVFPRGTDPTEVAEPLELVRLVADRGQHDPGKGRVWVHVLSEESRRTLGMLINSIQNQEVAQELAPFRGGAGAAPRV